VAEGYRKLLQKQENRVDVEVKTAVPLSDTLRDQIRQSVARFAGLESDLTEVVEPALIGGMVIRVGDRKIDTSIRSHLGRLREQLEERASRELQGDYFVADPAAG
jgi:F-type H+-transporting ATPase subunit delta